MHRALQIPEVLQNILSLFRVRGSTIHANRGLDNKTLAALSRTCRTFQNPALDVLWADLAYIDPLVLCLPEDLYLTEDRSLQGSGHNLKVLVMRRPLTPTDWSIYQRYAARVRTLGTVVPYSERQRNIEAKFMLALSFPSTTGVLFPRLREILWSDRRPETSMAFLRTLLSPQLTKLHLDWCGPFPHDRSVWDIHDMSLLSSIGKLCPSLTDFLLRIPNDSREHASLALSHLLPSLTNLNSVSCQIIDASTLLYLAGLHSLRYISFALTQQFPDLCLCEGFDALEELVVEAETLQLALSLLLKLHFSPKTVQFSLWESPEASCIQDIFVNLPSHCATHVLQTISLQDIPALGWDPDLATTVTFETVKPILPFHHLTTLTMDVVCNFDITDDQFEEMASAWPKLSTLELNTHHGWGNESQLTFNGFLSFLRKCPHLKIIAIALNAHHAQFIRTGTDTKPRVPGSGAVHHNLTSLNVLDSVIQYTAILPIADWLSAITPNLEHIHAWQGNCMGVPVEADYMSHWSEVETMYKAFVGIALSNKVIDFLQSYVLRRPLASKDWTIYRRYAARVRSLRNSISAESESSLRLSLDADIFLALAFSPTTGVLFPRLRRIHWNSELLELVPFLRTLLGPSLLTLHFDPTLTWGTVWSLPEFSMLSSLGELCPSLQDFSLARLHHECGPGALSQMLCTMFKLECLATAEDINATALAHLANLPLLRKLSLAVCPSLVSPSLQLPNRGGFKQLADLAIASDTLQLVTNLLASMHISPSKIGVRSQTSPDPLVLRSFFVTLSSHCAISALRDIDVCDEMKRAVPPNSVVVIATFRPLLKFHQLQILRIDVACAVNITDEQLGEMASAWPDLLELHINDHHGWTATSKITFSGPLSLLQKCGRLLNLFIALNTDLLQFSIDHAHLPGHGIANQNMTMLDVLDSAISPSAITPIAEWLSAVLPKLARILAWDGAFMMRARGPEEIACYGKESRSNTERLSEYDSTRKRCPGSWRKGKLAINNPLLEMATSECLKSFGPPSSFSSELVK
ncbi:hypothetical protein HYDPIDRAFT_27882 [Hydnomerulius pinastri MD-312]|uniref:F-box domain-containing protein n=1 Tax=Hydnomerulius pinastri MD-312 TaxID=994086 RepID=A0A0C9W2F4_9AGAM|nr:hypothetical protein HYDPIDRAFT_27882 [Hydnomerulius pinastri MD-312]